MVECVFRNEGTIDSSSGMRCCRLRQPEPSAPRRAGGEGRDCHAGRYTRGERTSQGKGETGVSWDRGAHRRSDSWLNRFGGPDEFTIIGDAVNMTATILSARPGTLSSSANLRKALGNLQVEPVEIAPSTKAT